VKVKRYTFEEVSSIGLYPEMRWVRASDYDALAAMVFGNANPLFPALKGALDVLNETVKTMTRTLESNPSADIRTGFCGSIGYKARAAITIGNAALVAYGNQFTQHDPKGE